MHRAGSGYWMSRPASRSCLLVITALDAVSFVNEPKGVCVT